MRPDQIERLRSLSERLAETCIDECDPDNWAGAGKMAGQMDQKERGDRYWDKKNGAATLTLLQRVVSLVTDADEGHKPGSRDGDEDMDDRARAAEKAAEAMLRRVGLRAHAP